MSPLLQSSIGELQKWDGHAQSLQSVRDCFDTHWPETKASLVADNKWDVLQNLTMARTNMGVGQGDPLEENRPSVLDA